MAAPSPEDLFQQAEWLIKAGQKELPHQVDIRRLSLASLLARRRWVIQCTP